MSKPIDESLTFLSRAHRLPEFKVLVSSRPPVCLLSNEDRVCSLRLAPRATLRAGPCGYHKFAADERREEAEQKTIGMRRAQHKGHTAVVDKGYKSHDEI